MLGGRGGLQKWRPSHAFDASDAALTWPWRGPDVLCGALVRCTFPAPTPPEPEREHVFFDAFEGIRVRPEGNACSRARRLTFHVPRGLTRPRGLRSQRGGLEVSR